LNGPSRDDFFLRCVPTGRRQAIFSLHFASRRRDIELLREPIPRALLP